MTVHRPYHIVSIAALGTCIFQLAVVAQDKVPPTKPYPPVTNKEVALACPLQNVERSDGCYAERSIQIKCGAVDIGGEAMLARFNSDFVYFHQHILTNLLNKYTRQYNELSGVVRVRDSIQLFAEHQGYFNSEGPPAKADPFTYRIDNAVGRLIARGKYNRIALNTQRSPATLTLGVRLDTQPGQPCPKGDAVMTFADDQQRFIFEAYDALYGAIVRRLWLVCNEQAPH